MHKEWVQVIWGRVEDVGRPLTGGQKDGEVFGQGLREPMKPKRGRGTDDLAQTFSGRSVYFAVVDV